MTYGVPICLTYIIASYTCWTRCTVLNVLAYITSSKPHFSRHLLVVSKLSTTIGLLALQIAGSFIIHNFVPRTSAGTSSLHPHPPTIYTLCHWRIRTLFPPIYINVLSATGMIPAFVCFTWQGITTELNLKQSVIRYLTQLTQTTIPMITILFGAPLRDKTICFSQLLMRKEGVSYWKRCPSQQMKLISHR